MMTTQAIEAELARLEAKEKELWAECEKLQAVLEPIKNNWHATYRQVKHLRIKLQARKELEQESEQEQSVPIHFKEQEVA